MSFVYSERAEAQHGGGRSYRRIFRRESSPSVERHPIYYLQHVHRVRSYPGVFIPDDVTSDYISRRRRKANRINSFYFKPDPEMEYAGTYTIDLSKVEASVAVYPNPDDVVPVSEKAGMHLDGVFIGAC